ncbi:hypothetical protein K431DRAFT_307255 [Polychaeton citri CBS 116435]|uniref:Uncharacterized protein n=1 Tax=Polychaeton citri CBS 116435 TaxID=1314669 RepID=A0A9P4Q2X3_9PEZI|nr:hypothetical protein K431DRAFT_307255 [Polychaeton citri CBS 116435]
MLQYQISRRLLKKQVNYEGALYARKLNTILFQMLYRKSVDLTSETGKDPVSILLLDISHLAQSYGCCEHIKGDILTVLFNHSNQNEEWFQTREGPCCALEVASILQDRGAFMTALRYAAAHRAAFDRGGITPAWLAKLPEDLPDVVDEAARDILEKKSNRQVSSLP